MVSHLCLMCGSTQKLSDISLGTRPGYSLVADEVIKKPDKQTNIVDILSIHILIQKLLSAILRPKKPCRRKRAGGSESTADATGAGCGGESSVSAGGSGLDGGCGGGAATVEAGDGACPAIGSQLSSEKQVQKKTEKNRERKARKKASRQEKAKIQLVGT